MNTDIQGNLLDARGALSRAWLSTLHGPSRI